MKICQFEPVFVWPAGYVRFGVGYVAREGRNPSDSSSILKVSAQKPAFVNVFCELLSLHLLSVPLSIPWLSIIKVKSTGNLCKRPSASFQLTSISRFWL